MMQGWNNWFCGMGIKIIKIILMEKKYILSFSGRWVEECEMYENLYGHF
jgi:hypothetical protein